ncbi:MAG: anthranilate synthase component I family protein [Chloroflexi bacterium]|nr:anthranilate synthase component I family protein [Chloroflexota bacterium]
MLLEATHTQTIIREISADLETPISVYMKLRGDGPSFLLESVEGGERIARYSFVGVKPRAQYILRDEEIEIKDGNGTQVIRPGGDPTKFVQEEIGNFKFAPQAGLPMFIGGLVGYLGYESVRFFEPTLGSRLRPQTTGTDPSSEHHRSLPDGIFLLADTVIAFDHARRSLALIANVLDGDVESAHHKLDEIESRIHASLPASPKHEVKSSRTSVNMEQGQFEDMVRDAQEHIAAGDIFQVVLSQRFTRETTLEPFDVYRSMRRINPSPYMFYFDFGVVDGEPLCLIGSSPEMFVRLEGQTASLRPIAGTRPRAADSEADAVLAHELLADPKERAEHVMLVDLARNDLGRVCEYGTVKVSDFFTVERYSHVMHMVSHVEGKLRSDRNAFDLVRASFPAGTVSGAPKVRAMEIISELEAEARRPYAGMVGYFGFDGNMDTCLAIRTIVRRGSTFSVQAGAGIVADSNPTTEYLLLTGTASFTTSEYKQLAADAVDVFYQTAGSLTSALRATAEALNRSLLERNMSTSGRGQYAIGWLTLASLRDTQCTLLFSGPMHVYFLGGGEVRHFHEPGLSGKGLGLGQAAPLRPRRSEPR